MTNWEEILKSSEERTDRPVRRYEAEEWFLQREADAQTQALVEVVEAWGTWEEAKQFTYYTSARVRKQVVFPHKKYSFTEKPLKMVTYNKPKKKKIWQKLRWW